MRNLTQETIELEKRKFYYRISHLEFSSLFTMSENEEISIYELHDKFLKIKKIINRKSKKFLSFILKKVYDRKLYVLTQMLKDLDFEIMLMSKLNMQFISRKDIEEINAHKKEIFENYYLKDIIKNKITNKQKFEIIECGKVI